MHKIDPGDTAWLLRGVITLERVAPALAEIARVGRQVVLAVPNFAHLKERLFMVSGRVPFQSRPQRGHAYWMNLPTLLRLTREAGLTPASP